MSQGLSDKLKEKLYYLIGTDADKFLNNPTKDDAITIAKEICTKNNKDTIISDLLNNLSAFEMGIIDGRDHVIHTVHTYLLGLIIIDALNDESIDKFIWKIASLFHDIGYENADYFLKMPCVEKFIPDHGLFSAIITWHILHSEYLEGNPHRSTDCIKNINNNKIDYNWNNLNELILPACEAILLHNMPNKYHKTKLSYSDNKHAFLLIICDTLQEWSRPLNGATTDNQSSPLTSYSIDGPCKNEDYCELSIYFPEGNKIKEVKKELNKKCNCETVISNNKLTVKWKY